MPVSSYNQEFKGATCVGDVIEGSKPVAEVATRSYGLAPLSRPEAG